MATKLHEVLAVESGLQTTAKKINEETIKTFGKKDEHFIETVKSVSHFAEDDQKLDTSESKAMVTTVAEKLAYNAGPNIKALDAYLQKEATNQKAHADVVVDDVTLAAGVPATVLLGLETKLSELRAVYDAIPTLAPGPTWELDPSRKAGVYKSSHPDTTFRTKRNIRPIELSPATQHHPAQVQAVQEDVPVAKITTQTWSGMMTPANKSELLSRLDKLIRAVKRARQRANNTEVEKGAIGKKLFDYIHSGIV